MQSDAKLEARTRAGVVRFHDAGAGEPLLFVHGVLADGQLWRKVVPLLADQYRCIIPDWPLGSHTQAMRPDADLSPPALAGIIVDVLDHLDLQRATIVGNNTGGALCQLVAANYPGRVARLVLTPCDAYENFPPRAIFWPLDLGARIPGGLIGLLQVLRLRTFQRLPFSFAGLSKYCDPALIASWIAPARTDSRVRADLIKVIRGIDRRYTIEAATSFRHFHQPTLIAWAPEARFFPMRHAHRLVAELPNARLEQIPDSYAFVSQDQPNLTAELILNFMSTT